MPELPEILYLSRQMDEALKDKEIQDVGVIQEKCINLSAEDFTDQLRGSG